MTPTGKPWTSSPGRPACVASGFGDSPLAVSFAAPGPAALDPAHDACGYCRMVVSDQRFASQLVAPYEEPRFFDDMGCLRNYLAGTPTRPAQARVYVADHRTKVWIPAERAVYTRVDALTAAMGSHIIAHESTASRDADRRRPTVGVPIDRLEGAPAEGRGPFGRPERRAPGRGGRP